MLRAHPRRLRWIAAFHRGLAVASLLLMPLVKEGFSSPLAPALAEEPQVKPGEGPEADELAASESSQRKPSAETVKLPVIELGEIEVKALGTRPRDLLLPQSVRLIDNETIRRSAAANTPGVLSGELGVVIQKTSLGGGSPIIRGRSGKDVLELIDGQRFNNSTFRRNNQYLNTIDLNAVGSIEVVRGPASVIHGSDAMGGAVNLITRRRELEGRNDLGGRLYQQYESATRGIVSHLGLEAEIDGWGFTGGFTYRSFDDLRAGNHGDPAGAVDTNGRQVPTAYREEDSSFSLVRKLSELDTLDFLVLETRQEGVPRSDRLIANDKQPVPPDLVNTYDPQVLQWYAMRYRRRAPGETIESVTVTASLNNPREEREHIKSSSPGSLSVQRDEVTAPGLSAHVGIRAHTAHLVTAGFDTYLETIDSEAEAVDLTTGATTKEEFGRYPDNAQYNSYGLFMQDEWELEENLRWTNGVRYSMVHVALDLDGFQVGPLRPFHKLSETYDDVTFATSLAKDLSDTTTIYGSIARGFRAPNLDDLGAEGDFAAGNRVPNLDLDPETVLSFEMGAKYRTAPLTAGAAGAVSTYNDLFDNELLFSSGGEDYFQVQNVAEAIVYSVEGWIEAGLNEPAGAEPEHALFAQALYNHGRNQTDREPLSKVPPAEGLCGYRLEESRREWFGEAFVRGALEQNRLSATDEADPRFPEGGTPAWWTFNLRGGLDLARGVALLAALENLFDQRYRVHGSGIDEPGRGVAISVDWRF
ncbi:MAG: TonB-dependent receptor [Planctomycetota bacterium]